MQSRASVALHFAKSPQQGIEDSQTALPAHASCRSAVHWPTCLLHFFVLSFLVFLLESATLADVVREMVVIIAIAASGTKEPRRVPTVAVWRLNVSIVRSLMGGISELANDSVGEGFARGI
jgi:hypothetical protein